ncbi:MAG: NfeD family protein [Bdellovibrionaceae bacterium]|nr:NfeD family protein [Pseudobdellovibrionaceae bacterium]
MEQFWIWLILGLALIGAELLSGAFVILFFGVGALITAVTVIVTIIPLALQILIFGVSSLALLMIFRKRFIKTVSEEEKKRSLSADVDTQLILSESLAPGAEAMVAYQGTHWTAVNLENEELKQGTRVRIERTEGIKIFVRRAH